MLITMTSRFTGKVHTLDLDITEEQVKQYTRREALIQDIFPNLTSAQREFIISGVTEEEWIKAFGEPEPDEE